MSILFEVHDGLPREAPGDDESTLRALRLMHALPDAASILDIGCGPGAQTIALARQSSARITAVDTHQPFLDELALRAAEAGVSQRIRTLNASMFGLKFEGTFDAIWSEGAIYIMGFEAGLRAWRGLLRRGGYIAVTELSWIKVNPPREVLDYWHAEYPGMASVKENLAHLRAAGYSELDHFILPGSSSWEPYYVPMGARVGELQQKYAGG